MQVHVYIIQNASKAKTSLCLIMNTVFGDKQRC